MLPVHVWNVRPESAIEAVETTEAGRNEEGLSIRKEHGLAGIAGRSDSRKAEARWWTGREVEGKGCGWCASPDSNIQAQSGQGAECIRKATSFRAQVYSPVVVVFERAASFGTKRLTTGPDEGKHSAGRHGGV